jgi:hypothetical protein
LVIAFADIEDIEKKSTAIFIPNAILISTSTSKVRQQIKLVFFIVVTLCV